MASGRATTDRHGRTWLLALLPLLIAAAVRGLWAPDEPRRAEVARAVFAEGHALVLHLCGKPYPDKPPLFFWLAGALGALSGWSVFAMRLLSLGATAGTAWLVSRLARRWWGPEEALWSPLILLSTSFLLIEGGRLQIDPLLMLLTTAALAAAAGPAGTSRAATRRALSVGAAAGLAALTKGPVAWLAVGTVLATWRLALGPAGGPRPARGVRALALVAAVLPVALWALGVVLVEPAAAHDLLFRQHVGRLSPGAPHGEPPWKYLTTLPFLLLPWTGPVLLGLRDARRAGRADEGLVRAAGWLVAHVAVFSLVPPKRDLYLLPALPAAALLAGRWTARAVRGGRGTAAATWTPAVLLGLLALALAALPFVDRVPGFGSAELAWRGGPVALGAGAGALWCAREAARGSVQRWARATLVTTLGATTVAAATILPGLDRVESLRSLARELAARPERPTSIPCRGVHPEAFRFYEGLPTVRDQNLQDDLERDGPNTLAIVSREVWEELPQDLRASLRVLHVHPAGDEAILVLGAAQAVPPVGGE